MYFFKKKTAKEKGRNKTHLEFVAQTLQEKDEGEARCPVFEKSPSPVF